MRILVRLSMGLALLVGLAGAGPSYAGTVNVTFALGGSFVVAGFGPLGGPGSGTATIAFTTPSASFTTIVPGPVHVISIAFTQAISLPGAPGNVTGLLAVTGGSLAGVFSGGILSIAGPLHAAAGSFVHCLTPACTFILGFPVTAPVPLVSAPIGPIGVSGPLAIGPLAGFSLLGTAGVFAGLPLSLTLGGAEIFRVHVPEPGSMLYLGSAAVAALGLLGVARRRH